ncbi:LysR family transcriptional regulator [Kibdelosporangium philippinense]|uniref:LysR family transcriptional regulator n=1 Tax=Kibdelosporangium philippinense TaxID=211113 RepID=A0ABS8ZAW6_9PSEU|nr:LysR family transcriptional regulator [Kibdelosporangium philippinense]MCE7005016.1 LysR family transcriptional regulator [Kibdelosporangium philippinense]
MELRNLRHFVALAEEQSFTNAASRELIVQSGLSSSVRALEKDVGARLFVRGSRPVRLTAAGEALLVQARHTLDAAAAAQQAVQDVQGVLAGRLRVGALNSVGHTLPFTTWLAEFALAHPGVHITVVQEGAQQMLDMVDNGELDCALVPATSDTRLVVLPLVVEPLVLACAPDHPLATNTAIRLSQLDGERFVEPPSGWAIRATLDDAFRANGLTRQIACEVYGWEPVLDLVRAGVGISLLPGGLDFSRPSWRELRLIPLSDVRLDRRIDFVYPKGAAASPATRRFVELLEHNRAMAVEQDAALDVPLDGSGQG